MDDTPLTLLERLTRKPADADWERFVRLFAPLLSRWARRLGVPATDVEDVLQEALVLLLAKLPRFRREPGGSFRAWLWTVFARQVSVWRRRQGRVGALNDEQLAALAAPEGVPDGEAEFRRALAARALRLVRNDFPEQTWLVFLAVAVEGRPGVEVARQFGVTANAVYLARGRVLARLREELADLYE